MRPRSMQDVHAGKDYPLQRKGSRSTVRIRGLRDVMASQKISTESTPATHAQRLSEISWLEREAERLERENNIFDANQERIQARLGEVAERREALLNLVRESLGVAITEPSGALTGKAVKPPLDHSFETFSMEYGRPAKAKGKP